MKLFLRGQWVDRDKKLEVRHPSTARWSIPFPLPRRKTSRSAWPGAVEGAAVMRKLPGTSGSRFSPRRGQDVRPAAGARPADQHGRRKDAGGRVFEAGRAAETMELSRKKPNGSARDAAAGWRRRRVGKSASRSAPCGVVVAITPFNFPLNLVCHKVGPALAGGNAVILKPASNTPLSALRLVEILLEAGLPPLAINCLVGSGSERALCSDERVRKSASPAAWKWGSRFALAGLKRVTMELGSNSPLIILEDADSPKSPMRCWPQALGTRGRFASPRSGSLALANRGDLLEAR